MQTYKEVEMKKIAFVMTSLNTGGITTSLLNLLNELQTVSDINIDVILFHSQESDKTLLPNNIAIKTPGKLAELISISVNSAKKMGVRYFVPKIFYGVLCKLFGHGITYKMIFRYCKRYGEYDYAISCSQSAPLHDMYGGCNEYVLSNIKAKKKITFIHCDYNNYGINDKYSHKIYKEFDKIAVVSESVGKVFLADEPGFASKTFTVRNCHNINKILSLSKEDTFIYNQNELNILTVARMGKEKGHIRVLAALKIFNDKGISYKWHLVGGSYETAPMGFIEKIKELGVESNIIFHGVQSNPYKYMPGADFLLVPSYHEAAPMVFDEARILHLPIVTTRTVSADEMVGNCSIGMVCENTDESLTTALLYIVSHPEELKYYKENTDKFIADNSNAIQQFMSVIGD